MMRSRNVTWADIRPALILLAWLAIWKMLEEYISSLGWWTRKAIEFVFLFACAFVFLRFRLLLLDQPTENEPPPGWISLAVVAIFVILFMLLLNIPTLLSKLF